MGSSFPDRSNLNNHHSPADDTDNKILTEEVSMVKRTRPSRACTVRTQQRLQELQRTHKPVKKEYKQEQHRQKEVEDEDVDDDQEGDEEGDDGNHNQAQCVGGGRSSGKIVTSLVPPPEPSQMGRWNLRSMWELASVLNFFHVFRPLLKITAEFSAEEFETALLNPNDTLSDIHIPLLKAIPPVARMALTRDTWVTVLCRKIRDCWQWFAEGDLPIVASQGRETEVYKNLDPAIRVKILKALCDIRVEQEDIRSHIDNTLKSGVHLSVFRKDRVGGDSHGVNFWYEDDPLIGHRLYREIRKAEVSKVKTKGSKILPNITYQWETVATNFDEFQDVSEKLLQSNSRVEVSLGKKLVKDMLPEIEKEHKRKEKLLKKQHRQALLLDNYLVVDGLGAGRSLRDRKPVTYTFDDYDKSINEAIKITKKKHPSPEHPLHRRESARLDALANDRSTSSTHPTEPVNDTASARFSDFAGDDDDVEEQRDESLDKSNRRRQRSQRYSAVDYVETVSDNEVEFQSDDDIYGEAVYDEEYLKKRKKKKISSGSEGDEEYKWDDDNAEYEEEEEEEEEDSPSASEEDSDEPRRAKKMPRRETKLRSRSKDFRPGLRRSKRATRIDYQQYELSESDKEAPGLRKRKWLVEPEEQSDETEKPDEHSDETENGGFTMESQNSEENAYDQETKSGEEEPREVNENEETTNSKEDNQLNKLNGTTDQEVDGVVGKRRYLDLNELAPLSGFDDGPSTVLKDDDKTNNL